VPTLTGGCHCGNLQLTLEIRRPPDQVPVRACACSFCRAHGARTVTDPGGQVRLRAREPAELGRYQFGQRTAEFLVCRRCGVYVAAVMSATDGSLRATVNINALAEGARFSRDASEVDYSGESAAERLARRAAGWTPAQWDAATDQPAG